MSEEKWATVYLGLGSNLGDRRQNLGKVVALLRAIVRVKRTSSIYDTAPVGNVNQPRFLNMVGEVHTNLTPMKLFTLIKGIESRMGRPASGEPGSPRIIDIDILCYDGQILDTPRLIVPHPRLTERAFVLVPLAEIAPDLVHPVNGKTIRELEGTVPGKEGVVKLED